eukprot:SM000018S03588  [mRNA]  locus=s18:126645:145823:- [translate_table: standard]
MELGRVLMEDRLHPCLSPAHALTPSVIIDYNNHYMRLVVANESVPIIVMSDNLRMVIPRHNPLFNRARSAPLAVAVLEVTFQAAGFLVGEKSKDGQTNLTRLEQALDVKVVSKNVFGILRRFQITPWPTMIYGSTDAEIKSVLAAKNVLLHAMAEYARLTELKRLCEVYAAVRVSHRGENLSQDMGLTQQCIDDLIDTSVLHQTVFHGQHEAAGLLESIDKEFKSYPSDTRLVTSKRQPVLRRPPALPAPAFQAAAHLLQRVVLGIRRAQNDTATTHVTILRCAALASGIHTEAFRDHVLASTGVAVTIGVDEAAGGDGALVFSLEVDFERGDWDWVLDTCPIQLVDDALRLIAVELGKVLTEGTLRLFLSPAHALTPSVIIDYNNHYMRLVVENASVPTIAVSDNLRMVKPRHDPLYKRARSAPLAVAVLEVTFQAAGFLVGEANLDGQTNFTRLEQALDVKVVSKSVFGILRRFQITPQTMSPEYGCTEAHINSVLKAKSVLLQAVARYARLTEMKQLGVYLSHRDCNIEIAGFLFRYKPPPRPRPRRAPAPPRHAAAAARLSFWGPIPAAFGGRGGRERPPPPPPAEPPPWAPCRRTFVTAAAAAAGLAPAALEEQPVKTRKRRAAKKPSAPVVGSPAELLPAQAARPPPSQQPLTTLPIVKRMAATDGAPWATVARWVVFSDLHLSRRTCEICIQVLQAVHAAAVARDAGIIFLGDFWHARGALPVEPLNAALKELQSWTQPAIFITGNHDQVSLGGEVHALEALEAANEKILVISEPTEYLGALWLPYRKDHSLIEASLRVSSSSTVAVKAVLCHIDVVGATINEDYQAKEGFDPLLFPPELLIYTGHYHKPHKVEQTQIEYVGSPYQISASEAGQVKRLMVLDRTWQKVEDVIVNYGPRHFVVPKEGRLPSEVLQSARTGDREILREKGLEVELVRSIVASNPRIADAEDLDAFALFSAYADHINLSKGATKAGLDILKSLNVPSRLLQRPQSHVRLDMVELEGFGPFKGVVRYPLSNRGVRIVTGMNKDTSGSSSNGAGKTYLVMAPLWALTGSTDTRPDSIRGLSTSEVVHQSSAHARVRVEGVVNGSPFTVERQAGRDTSVLHQTVFHGQHEAAGLLESTDKEFKEELSRLVNIDVWVAAKEASKETLKDARSRIEQLEGAAQQAARQISRLQIQVYPYCPHVAAPVSMFPAHATPWEMSRLTKKGAVQIEQIDLKERLWEEARSAKVAAAANRGSVALADLEAAATKCTACRNDLQDTLTRLEDEEQALEVARVELEEECEKEDEGPSSLLAMTAELDSWRGLFWEKDASVKVQARFFEECRNALDDFSKSTASVQVCQLCKQPVSEEHLLQHEAHLQKQWDDARVQLEMCEQDASMALEGLRTAEIKVTHMPKTELQRLRGSLSSAHQLIAEGQQVSVELAEHIKTLVRNHTPREVQLPLEQAHQAGHTLSQFKSTRQLDESMNNLQKAVRVAKALIEQRKREEVERLALEAGPNPHRSEKELLQDLLAKSEDDKRSALSDLKDAQQRAEWLREADTSFGHNGVQGYVLEGALSLLQDRLGWYLDILSGGSLGLILRPTKQAKGSTKTLERIEKVAVVRHSDGRVVERSLRQLSGGERRRVGLAYTLAFAELASDKSGTHFDLMVLDEVLQHLDAEGKRRMVSILRGLAQATTLIVSQADNELTETFDLVDVVVKHDGVATVALAEDIA